MKSWWLIGSCFCLYCILSDDGEQDEALNAYGYLPYILPTSHENFLRVILIHDTIQDPRVNKAAKSRPVALTSGCHDGHRSWDSE